MEEASKKLGSSSDTQTLAGEVDTPQKESCIKDTNPNDVSNSSVCDVNGTCENPNDESSAASDRNTANSEIQLKADVASVEDNVEKTVSSGDVERPDAIKEPETEKYGMDCDREAETIEVKPVDEIEVSELCNDEQSFSKAEKLVNVEMNDESAENGASHQVAGNELTDNKANYEVEDNGGACDAEQNVKPENPEESLVDGETYFVAEDKADQGKDSANKSEEDNNKMDVDSEHANEENVDLHEQRNPGAVTKDTMHSESAQVLQETSQLTKEETDEENKGTVSEIISATEICYDEEVVNVDKKEENIESMEIDYVAEEQVEKNEADKSDSNVATEMKIDEQKDKADMSSDLTETNVSADSANPNSLTEDAAPGEVEQLDHNALFDPSSDITNFIDFTGVSSWSGNTQDLKTDSGNVSLKEDQKASDMADEVPTVDSSETLKSVEATENDGSRDESNETCGATECPREVSDAIMESEENQENEGQKTEDQQDRMGEEDESAHEAPSINPTQNQDTEMEENPNNSEYAVDGTDSDIKTNGLKRKADVLSEDSPGEGRKTVSLAKVSFGERPSFKIGACIARAATQMAGSPSVLKGNETLSVESFVSQLHCAATDPVKDNVVSETAAGFFLDYRNSSALQQVTPEKAIIKRSRLSNPNAGGSEAFEFEEMGDTYWTDRVIHNSGEEQTPSTEKGNYQVVPVELKPAPVQRTRRPYRKRQPQISVPLSSASKKPANFDENAPAELIITFSETDTIPPEKSLSKMFRHFGPIRESQTEVDRERHRARVVFRKGADAEVAYNSAKRFNIFGTKTVNYEFSSTITETFKVHPYVVSLGEEEEEAALSLHS